MSCLKIMLKEKFVGIGSGSLSELEDAVSRQAARGCRRARGRGTTKEHIVFIKAAQSPRPAEKVLGLFGGRLKALLKTAVYS